MYQTVIAIQYISIIALFIESWIVFRKFGSKLHAYLFFACIANLVNNIGYLYELKSTTEETYLTALKISYSGRVWIAFALFLFGIELCGIKLNYIIKMILALLHVFIYIVVQTVPSHNLYYADISFEMNGDFPKLTHHSGIVHYLFTFMLISFIVVGIVTLIITRHREHDKGTRNRLLIVIIAMFVESVFVIIQRFRLLSITGYYDLSMLGSTIGTLLMLWAIFRYKLLETEQLAKAFITDKLSDGIVAAEPDGTVAYFNKPAEALFPELKKNSSSVVKRIDSSIKEGEPIKLNGHIYTPKAENLYDKGVVTATVYVIQDNTEIYKHAEELEIMNERANEANKAKSHFLAQMSHDIRTPINAVLGMNEMILRETDNREILSYSENIQTAGRTLLSIINSILDFSKIEDGKMEIIPAKYDTVSVINNLANSVSERAGAKGLKFNVKADPELPCMLIGDEVRLTQVIMNLLTNAVKYTERGSIVFEINCKERTENDIVISVSVIDTGIGIREEDMDKLFESFTRLEENRNRNIEGTGLGMSIVTKLLELMDSKLDVHSVYGKGSEFSFDIKQGIADAKPIGTELERRKNPAGRKPKEMCQFTGAHVLVTDDNDLNRMVAQNLLKLFGIKPALVSSGAETIERMRKEHFDIVFLDHMMPELDGIETLAKLKEQSLIPSGTTMIALTANAVIGAREAYLEAGFDDYLTKPIELKELEEKLTRYLKDTDIQNTAEPETAWENEVIEFEPVMDIDKPAEEEKPEEMSAETLKMLEKEGFSVDSGLDFCAGDNAFYRSMLTEYAQTSEQRIAEMHSALSDNDTTTYRVLVHALKSVSKTVGANDVSELARLLEVASDSGDIAYIKQNIDKLENLFTEKAKIINKYLLS